MKNFFIGFAVATIVWVALLTTITIPEYTIRIIGPECPRWI